MNSNHAIGFCFVALAPLTRAQTLWNSVNGPMVGAEYGKVCILVPDQNSDGYGDLLVGAPGVNQGRGAVYCLSGAYLATGAGAQTLWTVAPSGNPGDQFGFAIADVRDVTGDGVADYLIGQPGYDLVAVTDFGAIRLLNGSNHAVVSQIYGSVSSVDPGVGSMFGSAMAACGDITGDGLSEVVIGAPGSPTSYMRVLSGASLTTSGSCLPGTITAWVGSGGNSALGTAIVGGFDLDGDGFQEIAFSSPGFDGASGTDTGEIDVYEAAPGGVSLVGYYVSTIPLERFGQSLDVRHDYDGDGVIDIVVGAPNSPNGTAFQLGRVVVLSGARLAAQTPPYELYTFTTAPAFGTFSANYHFGAAVRASGDLNGDGVGEILAGAPDYFFGLAGPGRGFVRIYSGATGVLLTTVLGASNDRIGNSLTGALQDLDGDNFKEFIVAGSLSDAGGTDSGVVKCYRLFPLSPTTYCTGKVNSLGCTPTVASSGNPSASSGAPFSISATSFLNQKSGLLFYSHHPSGALFQGGFKCAGDPVQRTTVLNSGGSTSGADCTGTYSFDFNAHIASAVDPSLVAGAEVFAQFWSRDPQSVSTTSLSNALRLVINP